MSETSTRSARSYRPIAVGVVCFALGSMLVVRADSLPPGRVNGLADPLNSANTAEVSANRELSTADVGARQRLDAVVARLVNLHTSRLPSGMVSSICIGLQGGTCANCGDLHGQASVTGYLYY